MPLILTVFLSTSFSLWSQGLPTRVRVRAISRDAKIIGSKVGGARILIRDVESGRLLAQGTQMGGTGDTELLMVKPRKRNAAVFDTEGAAFFEATLMLAKPTVLEVIAEGPLGFPQAMQRASKTLLVAPGEHIEGDGVLLEIHGFIAQILSPGEAKLRAGHPFEIRVKLTMTCGCPIESGGLWDAQRIGVVAHLFEESRLVASEGLTFSGTVSTFTGQLTIPRPGEYRLEVLGISPGTANFGRTETTLQVN